METPLSGLAQALFFASLDAGPGIIPLTPNAETPTADDWAEELLRVIERRSQRILDRFRRKPPRKAEERTLASAQQALDLCKVVRSALTIRSAAHAATMAILAVSELWKAEHADAVKENARKGAHAALGNKPVLKIKGDVKAFWFQYLYLKNHCARPTNARFVMEAQKRWPILKNSDRVVLRWCTQWKKELKELAGLSQQMAPSS